MRVGEALRTEHASMLTDRQTVEGELRGLIDAVRTEHAAIQGMERNVTALHQEMQLQANDIAQEHAERITATARATSMHTITREEKALRAQLNESQQRHETAVNFSLL